MQRLCAVCTAVCGHGFIVALQWFLNILPIAYLPTYGYQLVVDYCCFIENETTLAFDWSFHILFIQFKPYLGVCVYVIVLTFDLYTWLVLIDRYYVFLLTILYLYLKISYSYLACEILVLFFGHQFLKHTILISYFSRFQLILIQHVGKSGTYYRNVVLFLHYLGYYLLIYKFLLCTPRQIKCN